MKEEKKILFIFIPTNAPLIESIQLKKRKKEKKTICFHSGLKCFVIQLKNLLLLHEAWLKPRNMVFFFSCAAFYSLSSCKQIWRFVSHNIPKHKQDKRVYMECATPENYDFIVVITIILLTPNILSCSFIKNVSRCSYSSK